MVKAKWTTRNVFKLNLAEQSASAGTRTAYDMPQFNATRAAIDDLENVMDHLRREGQYVYSDRLRTIIGRLARQIPDNCHQYREDVVGWK